MSFWNEDHPMQWKYEQVQAAIPAWGVSDNEKFSDSTNEDLTRLLTSYVSSTTTTTMGHSLQILKSGTLATWRSANMEPSFVKTGLSRWSTGDNDCMPSDEEQGYATDWMETMLNCIDFEYDESKNPANMKPKKAKVHSHPSHPRGKGTSPPSHLSHPSPKKPRLHPSHPRKTSSRSQRRNSQSSGCVKRVPYPCQNGLSKIRPSKTRSSKGQTR